MIIECPFCGYKKDVPDDKVPVNSNVVNCPACHNKFTLNPDSKHVCPNCKTVQPLSNACIKCHIIFSKQKERDQKQPALTGVSLDTGNPLHGNPKFQSNYSKITEYLADKLHVLCITILLLWLFIGFLAGIVNDSGSDTSYYGRQADIQIQKDKKSDAEAFDRMMIDAEKIKKQGHL